MIYLFFAIAAIIFLICLLMLFCVLFDRLLWHFTLFLDR